jgi:hypothetical protein
MIAANSARSDMVLPHDPIDVRCGLAPAKAKLADAWHELLSLMAPNTWLLEIRPENSQGLVMPQNSCDPSGHFS